MPVPHIPLELLHRILQIIWDDKLCARQRIQFMTVCPLVNKEWRATYDMLASRDVYIPSMQYLHYLLRVIATGQSHVHPASHFALRTRHVIVQTLLCDPLLELNIDNDAYRKLIFQVAHSSFTGLHRCFPAATHLVFDCTRTFKHDSLDLRSPSYVGLRIQLNDRSTVTAEWRIDLGYPIRTQQNWDRAYRLQMDPRIVVALNRHMHLITRGSLPRKSLIFGTLKLEGERMLTLNATWDPAPFSGKWTEDLDLYARRAAAGYPSFKRFISARWFYDVVDHVQLRARAMPLQASIAEARFYDIPLAALVNVFIVYRWPLVSVAYTSLIICFCSRHSFLVYVSIMTVGICAITASLSLVAGLAYSALKLLVALCAATRLVHLLARQLLYDDHSLFNIEQDAPPSSYSWRFFDVVLAASVNAFIMHRWPLVAAAYTGLIACFQCPRQSFQVLVYVSILTVGICMVTTSLLLFTELSFFVFKPFVALCALTRLVQFTVLVASYDQNR